MDLSSDALPPPTSDELDGTLTPLSQLELQLDTSPSKPHLQVFVEPPMLSASAKTKYKSFQQTFFADTKVDEVIGEGFKGGTVHYFARNDGGIAYSFPESFFEDKWSALLDVYKSKKAQGKLEPFDSNANYVHPLCRMKPENKMSTRSRSYSALSEGDIVPDSELDDDEDDYDATPPPRQQPSRKGKQQPKKELPFSPRKSRSRHINRVDDSDSDIQLIRDSESEQPTRRSSRTKKRTTIIIDDDDYDYDDAAPVSAKLKSKGKARQAKTAPPLYGRIRDIKHIDDDPYSDEENEPLRRHRGMCEKCHQEPAHLQLSKLKKRGRRKRKRTEDEYSDEEEGLEALGGWVQCLKCPVSLHWSCLSRAIQDEILKAIKQLDTKDWIASKTSGIDGAVPPKKHPGLTSSELTEFLCVTCSRGGICMGCQETALAPRPENPDSEETLSHKLLFRCFTCKRLAHYEHLPKPSFLPDDATTPDIAEHYQTAKSWLCADCSSFSYKVDKIIAWRPYPSTAKDPYPLDEVVNHYRELLPREYLVKWKGRSYRRLSWVPHMWLVSTSQLLRHFLQRGTKVHLLEPEVAESLDVDKEADSDPVLFDDKDLPTEELDGANNNNSPSALPDAERWISPLWKTTDRLLDILLWLPRQKKAKKSKKSTVIDSSEEDDELDENQEEESRAIFDQGEQPSDDLSCTLADWEAAKGRKINVSDIDQVIWTFVKWKDLGYEEASWDSPPRPGAKGYDAFKDAFGRFLHAREVRIPIHSASSLRQFDKRAPEGARKLQLKDASQVDVGQSSQLTLMPFQVDGVNWLTKNWWTLQHCILADEMGLGKTVQIVTFLALIAKHTAFNSLPALVVVPNTTVSNWIREFGRWAPELRAVPFYGEKDARSVIKKYELFHEDEKKGFTKAKFHVLVVPHDTVATIKDVWLVCKNQPRWEFLIIDEGQRLKNDESLLFRKLTELNTIHRVLMTGTPLNNNIRELFNLMNFLDPSGWADLEQLEKQYQNLDENLVKELHAKLRPYFLRRNKCDVLDLPPKNEVIVPLSMAPLQREIYKSILTHNVDLMSGNLRNTVVKGRLNNILMQLRKCLQHPYIYNEEIEPKGLPAQEAHDKLIAASAKLRFLKLMLPMLKARGHRVLLFSQFKLALNVIEDFLVGEGYKFLRLDGDTKGTTRQKIMDDFNKPGSEYFIFLLTTRAGGVGINLFTADTVIIFDPDFNPHQDLQAIARAYRYGQQKTCIVFKLMVKKSAEDRIMQIGKKKLALDHVVVQTMDAKEDVAAEDVQSILLYGAQELMDSNEPERDTQLSEQDVEKLIEKTISEAIKEVPKSQGGMAFSFAKVWTADKDEMEDLQEDVEGDSWAQALQKMNEEKAKSEQASLTLSGRGVRRKAADKANTKMQADVRMIDGASPKAKKDKQKAKALATSDIESIYEGDPDQGSSCSSAGSDIEMADDDFMAATTAHIQLQNPVPKQPVVLFGEHECGLCGTCHGPGQCAMTQRSENLAAYRHTLVIHAGDESWADRRNAVQAIDTILRSRGHLNLIAGQPLLPLASGVPHQASKRPKTTNGASSSSAGPSTLPAQTLLTLRQPPPKPQNDMQAAPACVLCDKAVYHHLKDCPKVLAGSVSIARQIRLLEGKLDPHSIQTVATLRKLQRKATAREILAGN